MNFNEKSAILQELIDAHPHCIVTGRLWERDEIVRVYLSDCEGAYIYVDKDGDLIGEGPKLSRVKDAQVWGPWEKAAKTIGRKLYA